MEIRHSTPEMAVPTLEIRGLTKYFGGLRSVKAFDLTVRRGDLAGEPKVGLGNGPPASATNFPPTSFGFCGAVGLLSWKKPTHTAVEVATLSHPSVS